MKINSSIIVNPFTSLYVPIPSYFLKYFRSDGILDASSTMEIREKCSYWYQLFSRAHPRRVIWLFTAPPHLQYLYMWIFIALPEW